MAFAASNRLARLVAASRTVLREGSRMLLDREGDSWRAGFRAARRRLANALREGAVVGPPATVACAAAAILGPRSMTVLDAGARWGVGTPWYLWFITQLEPRARLAPGPGRARNRSRMGARTRADSPKETAVFSGPARAERYDREGNQGFYGRGAMHLLEGAPSLAGSGLDLGCGTGISTEVLVALAPGVGWQGADSAQAMLEVAKRKPGLAGVALHHAQAEALPFGDHSFDVVVANFAWHWFAERAGAEVRRVLRPGGWLLASVPLRRFSRAAGNRALARVLLSCRRAYLRLRSQGLRFEEVTSVLPGPVRVARHELVIERERFADGRELFDVLDSRGALAAIFGDHAPTRVETESPVEFEWPFAVVHVQV